MACLNVFGDINQQLPNNCNINDWQSLSCLLTSKIFELNENYRNSEEIINFYNNKLNIINNSFGLKTKPVETIDISSLKTAIMLQIIMGNRVAIITNNFQDISMDIKELCTVNLSISDKAILLSVKSQKDWNLILFSFLMKR